MQILYTVIWSLVLLVIIVTAVIFSFGFILIAAAAGSLFGIYRYYLRRRRSSELRTRPYTYGEVIDLQAEVIRETIEARKPDERK
ncbi:hypothetical protein JT05_10430 [Desulfosporosinus sp. Tol-M]|jgi:hypothetical protein|nr:hypothetical protein JT05_10430 [Desulfosporosinus sp. Tol-M]